MTLASVCSADVSFTPASAELLQEYQLHDQTVTWFEESGNLACMQVAASSLIPQANQWSSLARPWSQLTHMVRLRLKMRILPTNLSPSWPQDYHLLCPSCMALTLLHQQQTWFCSSLKVTSSIVSASSSNAACSHVQQRCPVQTP